MGEDGSFGMKRTRVTGFANEAGDDGIHCPVCLSDVELTEIEYPFECGHSVCRMCDDRLISRDDHRCPTCRQPRIGMNEEVANELNLVRYRASQVGATSTMFFPLTSPTEDVHSVIHQSLADPSGDLNEARVTLTDSMPVDLVTGLLNIPDSRSIADWRASARRAGGRQLERIRSRNAARSVHMNRRAQRLREQLNEQRASRFSTDFRF